MARRVREFLAGEAGPYSLAIFRVALFVVVLRLAVLRWPTSIAYSRLPRSALVPPWRLGHVLRATPFSPSLARAVGIVLVVACVCGIIGLYARTSAAVVALAGTYFLGIPNFFGKVDHASHVLWFAAILAVSPCADVLSVDGVRRAWRRADTGDVAPPAPSRAYGLPIRLVWLLFGLVYFFPGWWKLRSAGPEWAWSDNLRNIAYVKWAEAGRLPWFASFVESHGLLLRVGAAVAVTFELGFLVALFWRESRRVFVVLGLAFHLLNKAFLYIDFWALYWLYVVFVPWDSVLERVGRRMFPRDAVAVYDDGCGICRRTVATLSTLDPLRRVTWVGGATTDLRYVEGERESLGYDAYRRIARRYPLLWPALPFLYLPPVAALGRRVYRHVADSRACAVAPLPAPSGPTLTRARPRAVAAAFAAFALPVVLLGFDGIEQGWPVSMYPAFVGYHPATILRIDATADGRPFDLRSAAAYPAPTWTTLSRRMGWLGPGHRVQEARRIYDIACARDPSLRTRKVVVLLVKVSTKPSERGAPPLSSEEIASFSP